LGLDAGGTKTHCLIGDERGNVLGFGQAGAGNYEVHGIPAAREEIRRAVQVALDESGQLLTGIEAIGMGIAGADIPDDYAMLEREVFTPLFGVTPRDFQNDSMAGLRGGTRSPFGIVIACGTGCVCAGKNRAGEHARVGGLGGEFGDECSGTQLGEDGLRRVWQARDGIIPPTRLTGKFLERAQCGNADDLFLKLYRRELTHADLQPMAALVFDAAREGDAAAREILERGGVYLASMVNAAASRLGMNGEAFDVVMAGSVFKGSSPVLIDAMRAGILARSPHAQTVMPVYEPVVGALLMGMEQCLEIKPDIYENLSRSLCAAEKRHAVRFTAE